jgi:sialate O-acetylesterase
VQAGTDDTRFCEIWEAEAEFARTQKNCGMAVIVDVGEIDNIHPGDKRTVAMRLAALALNRTYGRKDVPCDSPTLKSWRIDGDTFHLEFADCTAWVMHGGEPPPFEIAADDGKFVSAQVKFGNGTAEVRAEGVAEPKELRYMWSWRRLGHLKNEVGLPLGPFRIRRAIGR